MLLNFKSEINESTIKDLSKDKNEPEWMLKKRLNSYYLYKNLEEPSNKYGLGIINKQGTINIDNKIKNTQNKLPSNSSTIIESFENAIKNHESLIKENFMTHCINPSENKYVALHNSLWNNGVLIFIPKDNINKDPINITLDNKEEAQFNNILIIAEENCGSTILINKTSNKINKFSSNIIEVITKSNSKLNIVNFQDLENNSNDFSTTKILQKNSSNVTYTEFGFGSNSSNSKISSILGGGEANSKIYSLNYCTNTQNFDINISTIHKSPFTYSDILSANILDNKAKLIFNGLIKIENNAHNSVGYQKEENLLLSKEAEVYPIPNLQIENYDVKCSHSASTTNIDEEKIFYLMSRGLTEEQTKKLVIKGYFNKFLSLINNEEVKDIIESSINGKSKYASLN
ncbi:Fe-S cluster assembly protein SufD [Candidatus Woesearchaeota archaeon]|nr:Fe-S cluster assembly protein SufD [Candidatus Woesearchaeota archaeon]